MVGIPLLQTAAKLSVSIPMDLATAVCRRVSARGLSGLVARAMVHELEREQLQAFMGELDTLHGPVPAVELSKARRAWPKRQFSTRKRVTTGTAERLDRGCS